MEVVLDQTNVYVIKDGLLLIVRCQFVATVLQMQLVLLQGIVNVRQALSCLIVFLHRRPHVQEQTIVVIMESA